MGGLISRGAYRITSYNYGQRAIKHVDSVKLENQKKILDFTPKPEKQMNENEFIVNKPLVKDIDSMEITSKVVKAGILPKGVDYVKNSARPLPTGLEPPVPLTIEYGFVIPDHIPIGKLTMTSAISMVKAHQKQEKSIDELSSEHRMEKPKVEAITKYFRLFDASSKVLWLPPGFGEEHVKNAKLLDESIEATEEPLGGYSAITRELKYKENLEKSNNEKRLDEK